MLLGSALIWLGLSCADLAAALPAEPEVGVVAAEADVVASELPRYNAVWNSPSADAHGSMPIGNGDIGANVWVEPMGDVVFYVSKTDAWDENGRLCKVGRVRLKFDPPLAVEQAFRQELKLREGLIEIVAAGLRLELWVDANRPIVRLEALAPTPVGCRAEIELWRRRERPFGKDDDGHSGSGLSDRSTVVLADTVVESAAPCVTWYHRNTRSIYPLCLQVQHLEMLQDRFPDPLLNLTFGARLAGPGFIQDGALAIKSREAARRHELALVVLSAQTDTPHAWLAALERISQASGDRAGDGLSDAEKPDAKKPAAKTPGAHTSPGAASPGAASPGAASAAAGSETASADAARAYQAARDAHQAWWRSFWNRSWVFVQGNLPSTLPVNAHPWRVGVASDGGSRFRGQIAQPRVLGRALSAAQIAQLAAEPHGDERDAQQGSAPVLRPDELAGDCTVAAWIKPAAGEAGRILDKCTAGRSDGLVFDAYPGLSLRWIVGEHTMTCRDCLKPDQWQHVAATADASDGVRRIYLNGQLIGEEGVASAGQTVTRGYVYQRFMNACAGRGGAPIKFNGSIFTVEADPSASHETADGDPDWRRWGSNYWFQNTRLAYWPMLAAGDFEMLVPWFRMYQRGLALSKARIEAYYGFPDAAQFPETMYWWGLPNNGDYGWNNTAPEPANTYIRRHWNGGLELIAVLLDRYDFTCDTAFARDTLVPLADPLLAFFDRYWPQRDAAGKLRMEPAQSLETWQTAVNPLPDVAGLHFVLPRLLALPPDVARASQRARWKRLLDELPEIPIAATGDRRVVLPAEVFSNKRNSENPELYAVFPFRLYGVGRPEIDLARATYRARGQRHNRGWCQDSIQAACLGLGDEAARLVASRSAQINRKYRFPAMWGPNFDWIPDQDHGNNILTTLQHMLVQDDGERLHILPAWPPHWNVSFRLHAAHRTTVEGQVRDGKLVKLHVSSDRQRPVEVCEPFDAPAEG